MPVGIERRDQPPGAWRCLLQALNFYRATIPQVHLRVASAIRHATARERTKGTRPLVLRYAGALIAYPLHAARQGTTGTLYREGEPEAGTRSSASGTSAETPTMWITKPVEVDLTYAGGSIVAGDVPPPCEGLVVHACLWSWVWTNAISRSKEERKEGMDALARRVRRPRIFSDTELVAVGAKMLDRSPVLLECENCAAARRGPPTSSQVARDAARLMEVQSVQGGHPDALSDTRATDAIASFPIPCPVPRHCGGGLNRTDKEPS